MTKKIIQVPVDHDLLIALDRLSKKQRQARSELIRRACQRYLEEVEHEEMDRLYQKGYEEVPEEPGPGEIQVALAVEALANESW